MTAAHTAGLETEVPTGTEENAVHTPTTDTTSAKGETTERENLAETSMETENQDQNQMTKTEKNQQNTTQKKIRNRRQNTENAGISQKQEHANLEKIANSHTVNDYIFNTLN